MRYASIEIIIILIFLGHVTVSLDSLTEDCPETWIDRPIDNNHVNEIAKAIEKTPTIAKSMQSWIGIAHINKDDVKTKEMLRGCRITIIGGRHRHAAHKKVITTGLTKFLNMHFR